MNVVDFRRKKYQIPITVKIYCLKIILVSIFSFSLAVDSIVAVETISKADDALTSPATKKEVATATTSPPLKEEEKNLLERSYSFNLSSGITTFSGNRGDAYESKFPSLGLSFLHHFNKNIAAGAGVGYSKHYMTVSFPTRGFIHGAGLVEIDMLEYFLLYRYYANGDIISMNKFFQYTNPHLTVRAEFWNQKSKYIDLINSPNDSSGAIGAALGGGFEFPIKITRSYLGVEALYHIVNFRDTYTQLYRPLAGETEGFNDLTGNVISFLASYVVGW